MHIVEADLITSIINKVTVEWTKQLKTKIKLIW